MTTTPPTGATNITPVKAGIPLAERERANGHRAGILWFTGLSGAGKTTLALALQQHLFEKGCQVFVLDGDNVRNGLNRDLGFSPAARHENLRRAGEVAALFAQAGFIVIAAFISPLETDREVARAAGSAHFHSIYVKADLATCERRDVKGLYGKARRGEIQDFTGISAPYEEPLHADLVLDTAACDVDACLAQLADYVERHFILSAGGKASGV